MNAGIIFYCSIKCATDSVLNGNMYYLCVGSLSVPISRSPSTFQCGEILIFLKDFFS